MKFTNACMLMLKYEETQKSHTFVYSLNHKIICHAIGRKGFALFTSNVFYAAHCWASIHSILDDTFMHLVILMHWSHTHVLIHAIFITHSICFLQLMSSTLDLCTAMNLMSEWSAQEEGQDCWILQISVTLYEHRVDPFGIMISPDLKYLLFSRRIMVQIPNRSNLAKMLRSVFQLFRNWRYIEQQSKHSILHVAIFGGWWMW